MRNLFYELGVLFKGNMRECLALPIESFSFLPTPVSDSILTLSLPEKSQVRADSDLRSLYDKMKVVPLFFSHLPSAGQSSTSAF